MTSAPGQAARPTPGQTVGPFFGTALPYVGGSELVPPGRPDAIRLHGRVLDGAGAPVPDALIELWQTGPDGVVPQAEGSLHRDGWTFTGWGRAASDRLGGYRFTTRRPARTSGPAFFALRRRGRVPVRHPPTGRGRDGLPRAPCGRGQLAHRRTRRDPGRRQGPPNSSPSAAIRSPACAASRGCTRSTRCSSSTATGCTPNGSAGSTLTSCASGYRSP